MKTPRITLEPTDELNQSDLEPCSWCKKNVPRSTVEKNNGLCCDCLDTAIKKNFGETAYQNMLVAQYKKTGKVEGVTIGVKVVRKDDEE